MTVDVNWSSPATASGSGGIDLATGDVLTETVYDRLISDLYRLGGTDGNSKTGKYQISSSRTAFLTNSLLTVGLQIDQEGFDDAAVVLADSTDVAHGVTDLVITSGYGRMQKDSAADGGLNVAGFTEVTSALNLQGVGTTDNTTHTAAGIGFVNISAYKKSGTGVGSGAANSNLLCVRDQTTTRMICDIEGDVFADGSGLTIYDEHDDTALVRAFDQVRARERGAKGLILGRWDEFVTANEDALIEAGILGGRLRDGGLTNYTQLVRLHNGALWQQHTRLQELAERLDMLAQHPALAAPAA